jgi:hypothetical protein
MSYRNPVTYVDSQSGKYFASAIQNISNTTAGVIDKLGAKAEAERKKKEAENLKLLNDTTKFNLDYLNSANLASKDFDLQPSLQPALSSLVDQGSQIKAKLFNSKDPVERAELQRQLSQYESFFKGGGMKNLLQNFQEKRELYSKIGSANKAGSEGGVDMKKLDPKLAKFFLSTYNDRLPSDLGINIVNNNGVFDIVLNSTGGVFGKKGSYQQSLMALMSTELPTIPNMTSESQQSLFDEQIIDSKSRKVTAKGMATYLKGGGKENVGTNTFEFYEFDDEGRKLFRENMSSNVLATIAGYSNEGSLMDGPGTGFNSIESYYNNVLRKEGDPDLKIGNVKGTSLDEKSLERVTKYMLDNLEKEFEKGINPALLKKPTKPLSNNNKGGDFETKGTKWWENYKKDPAAAYTSTTGNNADYNKETNILTTYQQNKEGDLVPTEYDLNVSAQEEFVVRQLAKQDSTLGNTEDDRGVISYIIDLQRTQEKPLPKTFTPTPEQITGITTQLISDIKESKSDRNVVTNRGGTTLKITENYDLEKVTETLDQIKKQYPSFKGTNKELLNQFLILAEKQSGKNSEEYKELLALKNRL